MLLVCGMCLAAPFMVVRHVLQPNAWWSSDDVFSFPLFFLFILDKYATLAKKSEECYLLSLSHLVLIFLIVSNLNYFFFNLIIWHLIFISKFVLLFYDVSCLTLNVLISNLDSWLFYQILISFQFHPRFMILFLMFSYLVNIFLLFILVLDFYVNLIFLFIFAPQFDIWWYLRFNS
jgi:hypothetical protein